MTRVPGELLLEAMVPRGLEDRNRGSLERAGQASDFAATC